MSNFYDTLKISGVSLIISIFAFFNFDSSRNEIIQIVLMSVFVIGVIVGFGVWIAYARGNEDEKEKMSTL